MRLGSHWVTVLRASASGDAYGNEALDWDSATRTPVEGCSVQPVQGIEATIGRDTVVSRWNLFAPYETDLQATDRVEWAGQTYEIDGQPQRWDFPPLSHLTALLRVGVNA